MRDNVLDTSFETFNELRERGLKEGVLPLYEAAELIDALHILEENPGATSSAIARAAYEAGFCGKKGSGMKWRLCCLALLGVARQERNNYLGMNWFAVTENKKMG